MSCRTRQHTKISVIKVKQLFFKNNLFASAIIEWNKLDEDIHKTENYALFRKHLLSLIRPEANNTFNVHNAKGINLLTKLRVGFSNLK